jgi:hypothetical protein
MSYDHPQDMTLFPSTRGVDATRAVVSAYMRNGVDGAPEEVSRVPMRALCRDARTRGVQVEALIISLKHAWVAVAGGELIAGTESSRLLARVVTHCVEEYYAAPG